MTAIDECEESGDTSPVVCPICHSTSHPRYRVADYDYMNCQNCGHVFIDERSKGCFGAEFYNSDIYKSSEASWPKLERLDLFCKILDTGKFLLGRLPTKILDYGAGTEDLKDKAELSPITTFFDPHFESDHATPPVAQEQFDFVVLTEVLEHVFDPIDTLQRVRAYSRLCLATTLLHDLNFSLRYLLPEAGHVSIYSIKSISIAAQSAGFSHEIAFWPEQFQYYYHIFRALHQR